MQDSDNKIKLLQKDFDSLANISDKFDTAIGKLSEVVVSIDKMMAIHEMRLEHQEKQTELIHNRISGLRTELLEELKENREESMRCHTDVSARLQKLEKWRWFVVGAAAVVGFFIQQNFTKILAIFH